MRLTIPPTRCSLSLPNRWRQPKVSPKHSKQPAGWNGCAARTASGTALEKSLNPNWSTTKQDPECRLPFRSVLRVLFLWKYCGIGLTSNGFDCSNPAWQGISLWPLPTFLQRFDIFLRMPLSNRLYWLVHMIIQIRQINFKKCWKPEYKAGFAR